ncbi:MAG: hypothetical protein IAG13_12450 [Deltaproteobacteria bacterium]|nr:hypothetical protein [Nannocystaceae bacterium]
MTRRCSWIAALLTLNFACLPADNTGDGGETEVISRLQLTFTPPGGGTPVVAMFDDPDGDSGVSGMADAITLPNGVTFELDVAFVNGLAEPPVDITTEVEAEAEEHLVLVFGDAVQGPASSSVLALVEHAYADRESDYGDNAVGEDLPLGVRSTVTTERAGTRSLRVMLRHMPPIGGEIQKRADVPELAAMDQPLPGDVDADVTFALTVQ